VKAKARRRAKPPLVSPHWWPCAKALQHVRTLMGGADIADSDLVSAIERGNIRSKLEQVLSKLDPPARRSELLTPQFYQRDYRFVRHPGLPLALQPRKPDQALAGRWGIYLWGPDIEKLWPGESPSGDENHTESEPEKFSTLDLPKSQRRPGPQPRQDWRTHVVREVIRALRAGENIPTAAKLAQKLDHQPDIRAVQRFLRDLGV
jgi:hypothetical protein